MTETREKIKVEDDWDTRALGASEEFVKKSDENSEKQVDGSLGLQSISIRLQRELINDLKQLASDNGLGYQPYIRHVLTQHVKTEKKNKN